MSGDNNGWSKAELHVMEELDRLAKAVDTSEAKLAKKIDFVDRSVRRIELQYKLLEYRTGAIGLIASSIPVAILVAFQFING